MTTRECTDPEMGPPESWSTAQSWYC